MPKPQSKSELIKLSQINYSKLKELIASYPEKEIRKEFPKGTLNRSIRDVLAHLHHWHLMMLEWYEIGMIGNKPNMPAKGYTWKTLPQLNKEINKKYQNVELEQILELLNLSYLEIQKLIANHSNNELFERRKYKWDWNHFTWILLHIKYF